MGDLSIYPRQKRRTDNLMMAHIRRWRENVLDLEIVVDDKRDASRRALQELHAAVRERNRAAQHLHHLITIATSSTAA